MVISRIIVDTLLQKLIKESSESQESFLIKEISKVRSVEELMEFVKIKEISLS